MRDPTVPAGIMPVNGADAPARAVDEIIDRAPPVVAGGYAEADRV